MAVGLASSAQRLMTTGGLRKRHDVAEVTSWRGTPDATR